MSRILLFVLILGLMSSCGKKPFSSFLVEADNYNAPAVFKFIDQSTNSDSISWSIDEKPISSDSIFEQRFLLSGKYHVKLKALGNNKISIMEKEIEVKPPTECLVEIETAFGNMLVKLFDETPLHRDNFLKLTEKGFYDGLLFHRVIGNFMVQGGDPNSRDAEPMQRLGSGSPGYQISAEFSSDLAHWKGALAAARMGDAVNPEKKSSGSQFYIVHGDKVSAAMLDQIEYRKGIKYSDKVREIYEEKGGTPFLDNDYTVFGQVVEGLDVIDKIAASETDRADRPVVNISMKIKLIK